ncbi:MAG: hypothetical protein HFI71_13505 [Lachnospiraceae bacterium]|nr:hypothetical protein [Lachnospiraceae bacterium]
MDKFAVIDIKTNWNDEIMLIGFDGGGLCYKQKTRYDIMRLAAHRQYNRAILDSADCCKTGKLKRGYGVENVLRILSKNERYRETHNALLDALDKLKIMQLLGCEIREYDVAYTYYRWDRTDFSAIS